MTPQDLATREYWDRVHTGAPIPTFGRHRPERVLLAFVAAHLHPRAGQRMIELGVGNSRYLPALARHFGYRAAGLDYSPVGVALAQRNLAGLESDIREGDLFEPPSDWVGAFDVVASFGVVEHFDDTAAAVRASARYLAPGGRMLTVIPNLGGLPGIAQRWLQREIYDRHVVLTADRLAHAHRRAGLEIRCAAYLASVNAGTLNSTGAGPVVRLVHNGLKVVTRGVWAIEDFTRDLPANRWTSPWVVVVAQAGRQTVTSPLGA